MKVDEIMKNIRMYNFKLKKRNIRITLYIINNFKINDYSELIKYN